MLGLREIEPDFLKEGLWGFFFLLAEGEGEVFDAAEKHMGSEDATLKEPKGGNPTGDNVKASTTGSLLSLIVVSGKLYPKIPP